MRLKSGETPGWMIEGATAITHLGDGVVLAGLSITFASYLVVTRRFKLAGIFLLSIATAFLISAGLKSLFQRLRPDEVYRLYHTTSPSFPSGHALRSMTVYLLLSSVLADLWPKARVLFLAGLILAVLIGLSRIWLGVHWPSDVLSGWIIGFLVFYGAYKLIRRYSEYAIRGP